MVFFNELRVCRWTEGDGERLVITCVSCKFIKLKHKKGVFSINDSLAGIKKGHPIRMTFNHGRLIIS